MLSFLCFCIINPSSPLRAAPLTNKLKSNFP